MTCLLQLTLILKYSASQNRDLQQIRRRGPTTANDDENVQSTHAHSEENPNCTVFILHRTSKHKVSRTQDGQDRQDGMVSRRPLLLPSYLLKVPNLFNVTFLYSRFNCVRSRRRKMIVKQSLIENETNNPPCIFDYIYDDSKVAVMFMSIIFDMSS